MSLKRQPSRATTISDYDSDDETVVGVSLDEPGSSKLKGDVKDTGFGAYVDVSDHWVVCTNA
jgi:hypothetical protein